MRKKYVISMIAILTVLLYTTNYLRDIRIVKGTKLYETWYCDTVNVSGEFENELTTEIKLSYPFFVKEVYVNENDYVNYGQALFSLDVERMQDAMNGEVREDSVNLLSYSSSDEFKNFGAIMAYTDISDVVYAPADGTVSEINIYNGALVMKNSDILSIKNGNRTTAKITVSQTEFGKIKVGDKITITPVAFPDYSYTGVITDKSAVVKKQMSVTGTKVMVDVFAVIDNPDKLISDGLQFSGVLTTGNGKSINILGYECVKQDEKGEYVYVLDNGKSIKKYIETGVETASGVEIVTVFPKDTIFLAGELSDGEKVIVKG